MVLLIRNPIPRMWQFSDNPDEILTVKLFIQQPYYDSRLYECVFCFAETFELIWQKFAQRQKTKWFFVPPESVLGVGPVIGMTDYVYWLSLSNVAVT